MSDSINLERINNNPYSSIFKLAMPLILANSGAVLMQFIDGILLSWYSPLGLGAAAAGAMGAFMILSLFIGTTGYAASIGSQYLGSNQPEKLGPVVWQSIYFALISSIIVFGFAFLAKPLFTLANHSKDILPLEISFFSISCMGGVTTLLASATSTFFTARGDTKALMYIQVSGLLVNALVAWLLIFGIGPFPEWGVGGAAIATILAQGFVAGMSGVIIFGNKNYRLKYQTVAGFKLSIDLLKRLIWFGLPTGFRFMSEVVTWTLFLLFIGRIGPAELSASSIVFRINGIAFFPVIGLASAVGILVGHAQGAKRPDISLKVVNRGFLIGEVWMLLWALLFIVFPHELLALFGPQTGSTVEFNAIVKIGTTIMYFVAAYCILDGCNIIYGIALSYAGDTRWTFIVTVILNTLFLGGLIIADINHASMHTEWLMATCFIMFLALVWVYRFYSGAWKKMSVIA